MSENSSNITNEWYSFPKSTRVVDNYLTKRAEMNETSLNNQTMLEYLPPFLSFSLGTYFAIECMTPFGSAARMIKEQRQGPARWFLNRIIPTVAYGYTVWWLRNRQYRSNPYTNGELA